MNSKIVAAPILAIALALFLAGAISYLPVTPTPNDQLKDLQSPSFTAVAPTAGTPAPMPQAASLGDANSLVLFVAGAVIIGMLTFVLLFREKDLIGIE